jgi:hypothetical protein
MQANIVQEARHARAMQPRREAKLEPDGFVRRMFAQANLIFSNPYWQACGLFQEVNNTFTAQRLHVGCVILGMFFLPRCEERLASALRCGYCNICPISHVPVVVC